MSLNQSWAPIDATSADVWGERALLDGSLLGSVAYGCLFTQGVHLTLFALCFNMLLSTRRKTTGDWFHLVYICVVFVLGTIGNALTSRWSEMGFIDNVNFPGGPNKFSEAENTNWVLVTSESVYVVNLWLADGLLLYRFFTIWRRNVYVTIIPVLAFCATVGESRFHPSFLTTANDMIVLGCLLINELPKPYPPYPLEFTIQLPVAFWSLSIAFNVLLTLAIIGRLLYMRWRIRSTAASVVLTPYVSISAMLIESAAVYTITGLVLVIGLGLVNNIQLLAQQVLGQTQGKAWSMGTYGSFDNPTGVLVAKDFSNGGGSTGGFSNELPPPFKVHDVREWSDSYTFASTNIIAPQMLQLAALEGYNVFTSFVRNVWVAIILVKYKTCAYIVGTNLLILNLITRSRAPTWGNTVY
ncbi:hypothetical protein CONPUDRAFT_72131 [Coniophora puteana RWD-64-598 SS2]|uniref:Uncharacterized protein n=1 Tax=Coniophora puteana (strain RWD-64-598) TaxID=741705 RepID=A0A5M3MSU9_CONPW|nr:uncharacterized protein CONPUDRAFT_72131 [Coniophora puteana RWD-64-598 SS2]EIW81725.1 hypothetical protein CONPUDRAFT_72131 [Coniophora puteana RWD-64-598 SS2]